MSKNPEQQLDELKEDLRLFKEWAKDELKRLDLQAGADSHNLKKRLAALEKDVKEIKGRK